VPEGLYLRAVIKPLYRQVISRPRYSLALTSDTGSSATKVTRSKMASSSGGKRITTKLLVTTMSISSSGTQKALLGLLCTTRQAFFFR
jgi:hypothetical protein